MSRKPKNKKEAANTPVEEAEGGEVADLKSEETPEPLSEQEEEHLRLEHTASELEQAHDKYLRAVAELENYRKRAVREQQRTAQLAVANLVRGLLPAIDNFERACQSAQAAHDFEALSEGVRMVEQQIFQTLNDNRVEEIEALHKPFDPACHEVVTQEATDEYDEGTVVRVFERGFRIGEIVIRAAKVAVAAPPAEDGDGEGAEADEPCDETDGGV